MRALRAGAVAAAGAIGLALLSGAPATSAPGTDSSSGVEAELPRGCVQPDYDPSATVPPLVQCDRAGTDQDEVFSIAGSDYVYQVRNGPGVDGNPQSVRGRAEVVYDTGYYDSKGYFHDGPTYTASFDDSGVSGPEVPNYYTADVLTDTCRIDNGYVVTQVRFSYVNPPDGRLRYVSSVQVRNEFLLSGGGYATRIMDGETRLLGKQPVAGGWSNVGVVENGRYLKNVPDLWLPRKCGGSLEPPAPIPPKGRIQLIGRSSNAKADLDNRGGMEHRLFQIVAKSSRGQQDVVQKYAESHGTETLNYKGPLARSGTRYTLQAQVTKAGKLVWKTIATKTAP